MSRCNNMCEWATCGHGCTKPITEACPEGLIFIKNNLPLEEIGTLMAAGAGGGSSENHPYITPYKQFIGGGSTQKPKSETVTNSDGFGEWIPVTERLPEKDGCYLVTACDEGCPYGEGIWYDTVVVIAEYYDDGRWLWYEGITEYDLCDIVTHWMPLPQPPKGEQGCLK